MLIICLLFSAQASWAQDDDLQVETSGSEGDGATTVLSFTGDDTIEGQLKTPEGELLESRKKNRHGNLIRVRTHFRRFVLSAVHRL